MTFVALSLPVWPTGAAANDLLAHLLAVAPRAAVSPSEKLAWLDARGLDAHAMSERAREALGESEIVVHGAAASAVPIVAAIAARGNATEAWQQISPGREREYLAPLPLSVLAEEKALNNFLFGIGITRCGALAQLSRESVEVRFGREGIALWRLARADDPRHLFSTRPRDLPTASMDWTEFSTTDLEQLVFVMNSLLGTVCEQLASNGMGARAVEVTLSLENRQVITQQVTAARSTSQRTTWLRLIRSALEKIELPDRVTGVAVQIAATGHPTVRQGDFFDLGFASAHAAEAAVGHILDLQSDAVLVPQVSAHPLFEQRIEWKVQREGMPEVVTRTDYGGAVLHPQLLPLPRAIQVLADERRGFSVPARYTDNGVQHPLIECLGPHCVSGMSWREPVAREYHQGVRDDGHVVLLYRDALVDEWYLAGWWD